MKTKKILTGLLATASIATLLAADPITINAANKTETITKTQKHYVIKNVPKLSKWGYIVNYYSDSPVLVGKSSYQKMLNNPLYEGANKVKANKVKNVRFKIVKVMEFHDVNGGTPQYLATSKNHKYNVWATSGELRYYNINSKSLKNVIKPLKRIDQRDSERLDRKLLQKDANTGRVRIAKNKHDFNLAVKAAKKLKGKQRKFILASLAQMKKDGDITDVMQDITDNLFLWSIDD